MENNHRQFCFQYFNTIIAKFAILFLFSSLSGKTCYLSEAQRLPSLTPALPPGRPISFPNSSPSRGLQFKQREVLDQSTDSILEWQLNRANASITFAFSTRRPNEDANSVFLLGFSREGNVEGADVVAIRINEVGSTSGQQLVDMHGVDNNTVIPDSVQNWRLVSSNRNSSHVTFTMIRSLDTCDEQDIPINREMVRIIWESTSNTAGNDSFNFNPEESIPAYLTDPIINPPQGAETKTWRLSTKFQIPPRRTSYWCTIHRGLQFSKKHQIVGYAPYFNNELSRKHVHHQLIHRCIAPPGIDPAVIFEKFVGHPGEECYLEDSHELPTLFCSEVMVPWAMGGKPFYFPDDVGVPIGETRNEYFMLEAHYDNPESRSDLVVENGADFYYSEQLRPNDGSVLFVGGGMIGLFQVPPRTPEFRMAGHCSSECTSRMFASARGEIVAAGIHAHMTARKGTLKHIRGNRELPWIQSDDNYDHTFQQVRLLPERVIVQPGDHLMTECVYDTTSRNATTLSGFATSDEMCMTFVVLKNRIPFTFCTSEFPTENTMARYGITNITWSREGQERVVNTAENRQLEGLPLWRAVDQSVGRWTTEMIRRLEWEQIYEDHDSVCPSTRNMLMIAYAAQFVDDLTFGIIPGRDFVENTRPSTRLMSSPPNLGPLTQRVRYPPGVDEYTPQRICSR